MLHRRDDDVVGRDFGPIEIGQEVLCRSGNGFWEQSTIISNEAQLKTSASGPAVMLREPGFPIDSVDGWPTRVLLHCIT